MDLGALIQSHGYGVLAAGCLLEGETVLILAGFAAHRGHLWLPAVLAVAALSGFAGDQFFFWLGRRHGAAVMARWPRAQRQVGRVQGWVERHPAAAIVCVRFAYGLRTAGPVIIGMSGVPAWRFAGLNAVGAVLWAVLLGGAGWVFGQAAEVALARMSGAQGWLLLALVPVAAALWWWHRRRRAGSDDP